MEKSLIIIKPDLEKNLAGKEKLINLISDSGLTVYDTSQIIFNNWMIESMWPQFQSDVISMKILSNYLDKKKLEILYLEGENALENTLKINFIFGGERSLYFRLSAQDNLFYFADLYKIPRKKQLEIVPSLLKLVGLENVAKRRVETFSKGMKQRLQIARALLNDPEIIFLDEPSIGLDPVGALELRNIIKDLAKKGKTILLTTHYMAEAEELCDRIAIINHGEIVTCGTIEEIATLVSDEDKSEILEEKTRNQKILDVTLEDIYLKLVG